MFGYKKSRPNLKLILSIFQALYNLESYMIHVFLCILTSGTRWEGYFSAQVYI